MRNPVSTDNEVNTENEMQVVQDTPVADTEGEQVQGEVEERAQEDNAEVPDDRGHAEGDDEQVDDNLPGIPDGASLVTTRTTCRTNRCRKTPGCRLRATATGITLIICPTGPGVRAA